MTAGIVTLKIDDENQKFYDRNSYHVLGIGRTKGIFNMFYKVIDRYETYIDEETLAPWKFIRRVDEGDFRINQDVCISISLIILQMSITSRAAGPRVIIKL